MMKSWPEMEKTAGIATQHFLESRDGKPCSSDTRMDRTPERAPQSFPIRYNGLSQRFLAEFPQTTREHHEKHVCEITHIFVPPINKPQERRVTGNIGLDTEDGHDIVYCIPADFVSLFLI
jgi:hypothetical protein